ncbi:MAG: dTMP kinase [Candidatus Kerfeldbacteria bacterium]|nr:dTMP kinase [Candidatus Kerfeldbacteria bacterium]
MIRGKFIVFEGGEGSGKSHHVKLTQQYLRVQGWSVVTTYEPGATVVGQAIRRSVLRTNHTPRPKTELFLFLADRAEHVEEYIKPQLQSGTTVVCDRFSGSTLAYQIGGRKLAPVALIKAMDRYARSQLRPDLVIYLDVDPIIGLQRKRRQMKQQALTRFEAEHIQFHRAVRRYFRQLVKQPGWIQINANRTLEQVQVDINTVVNNLWL